MKIRSIVLVFLFPFFIVPSFAQEQKMSAAEVASFQKIMGKAAQVKTLVADFTQYKKVNYVKNEIVSSGKFYVKNPDRLAWIYKSPMPYTMIFNNKKMMLEEKGKKKMMDLSRSKQYEKISQAIQVHMNGSVYKDADFSPSYFQTTKHYILKLDPISKDIKKSMKQMVLYFDKSNQQVSEIKLFDASNGVTRFVFTNQIVNGNISDSVFEL